MGSPHTFESLKAKTTEEGDCWLWDGYHHPCNAPQIKVKGKTVSVRKLFLMLLGKPVQDSYYFDPKCGNKNCVNPDHVVMRKPADHYRWIGKESTKSVGQRAMRAVAARREFGKLDMDKVREIRATDGPAQVMADKYGIHVSQIRRIRRGEAWQDFSNPWAGLL